MAWYRCRMNGTYRATTVSRSGAICNYVSNVGGVPLSRFIANITPIQEGSGDPSPSNPRAIAGVSEVNVHNNGSSINQWDEQWELGSYNWNTGVKINANNLIRSKNKLMLIGGQTYYFKVGKPYNIFSFNLDGSFINALYKATDGTFTPTNDLYIAFSVQNSTTYNNDVSINYPATDTAYHAYTGQTATINLGGTYYGDYLNVITGLLTVAHVDVDLGSLNWSRTTSYNNPFFYASKTGLLMNTECICEIYKPIASRTSNNFGNNAENNQVAISSNSNEIFVRNDSYSDATTFKTAMSGFKLVYELATPQTYQLTPVQLTQLLGENNVWADSGDSEVDFFKIIRT